MTRIIDINAEPRIEFVGADGKPLPSAEGALAFVLPDFGLMFEVEVRKAKSNADALRIAKRIRTLGYKDWCLSGCKEFELLINRAAYHPATWSVLTPITPIDDWYWTRDRHASGSGYAWCVGFSNGNVHYSHRDDSGRVRAVRSVAPSQ